MPINNHTPPKRRRVWVDPIPAAPAYPRLAPAPGDYTTRYNDMLDRRLRRVEQLLAKQEREQRENHNSNHKK
jgi:hypothetical protein